MTDMLQGSERSLGNWFCQQAEWKTIIMLSAEPAHANECNGPIRVPKNSLCIVVR